MFFLLTTFSLIHELLSITSGIIYIWLEIVIWMKIILQTKQLKILSIFLLSRNAIIRNILILTLLCGFFPSTIFTRSFSKCPSACICDLDKSGRYLTQCRNTNMREVPTSEIDEKMEIIEIENPGHVITIGNIFTNFKKLEILRITNSGVPAIGMVRKWHEQST